MTEHTANSMHTDLTHWGSTAQDRPRSRESAVLIRLGVVLAALIVAVILADAAAAGSIRLLEQAGAAKDTVTLADVAELEGDEARALGNVVVLKLKKHQDRADITLAKVREVLAGAEVNWARMTLKGYTHCRVTRTASDPEVAVDQAPEPRANPREPIDAGDPEQLRALIRRQLAALTGVPEEELEISYLERDLAKLRQTRLVGRFEVEPLNPRMLGRTTLRVRRFEGLDVTESLTLTARISRRTMALVADQPVRRGRTVPAEAISLREVLIDDDRDTPLTDRALVAGQTAATDLDEGDVIYPHHLRAATLVKRGEPVKVATIAGGLVIRASAVALEDGGDGDVIEARNQGSREKLTVRVTGLREAVVIEKNSEKPGEQERVQQ